MRKISEKDKKTIGNSEYYKHCALASLGGCGGRITIEHAEIYAGKQIDEMWNYVPICAKHHGVDEYQDVTAVDKSRTRWVAFNQATDEELNKYYKAFPSYVSERNRLNNLYGNYTPWRAKIYR